MATATLRRSKKTRKNVPDVNVFITATLNNTHVVVSDPEGQILTWSSGGSAGFKWAREATPYAAQIVSEQAVSKAKTLHNVERANVYVKWIGSGREQAVRGIANAGVDLTAIYDVTPVPHNGCRKRKARKL
jgi:small subunit ribosomal protein S11